MKRFLLVALTVMLGAALTCYAGGKKEKATVVFQTDMHCHKCAEKVNENISFEKGVLDVKIDEKTKQVTITYDARKTSVEKLQKSIQKLGYTATPISGKECTEEKSPQGQ